MLLQHVTQTPGTRRLVGGYFEAVLPPSPLPRPAPLATGRQPGGSSEKFHSILEIMYPPPLPFDLEVSPDPGRGT